MSQTTTRHVQTLTLDPPTLANNTADAERLTRALCKQAEHPALDLRIDRTLLQHLPEILRRCRFRVRCTFFKTGSNGHLIDVHDPHSDPEPLGLAVDLGTSRVVLRLVDLSGGSTLAETAITNPQTAVGPDVLTRIHYSDQAGGLKELNRLIVDGINTAAASVCRRVQCRPEDIHLLTVAGNTAMTHLFLGLNPHWIIREPYIPVVNRPGSFKAATLGLNLHASARVFVFPNSGSYFGGDLIAGILHSGLHESDNTAILVDVGTNAEVVLGNRNWLIACAGAAGPALEGGVTRMGMMAGPGVIDHIRIDPATRRFVIRTIDDLTPCGICGSGLIDLAAQLFLSGMIDFRGHLVPRRCGRHLKTVNGLLHLVVVPAAESATGNDLTISQADLDSLMRSKAAMFTILETVTRSVGVDFHELDAFFVAGTFGSFIRPESAITIGMLPDLPTPRYESLGNSSLGGATQALAAMENIDTVDRIRDRITYLELNVNQEFMNRFSAAKFLPHTNRALFPSVAKAKR